MVLVKTSGNCIYTLLHVNYMYDFESRLKAASYQAKTTGQLRHSPVDRQMPIVLRHSGAWQKTDNLITQMLRIDTC